MSNDIRTSDRYHRQLDLIDIDKLQSTEFTIIGAGALGSFTAITLAKMGGEKIKVFDDDKVEVHNLPMQFYRQEDLGKYKVEALHDIIKQFEGVEIEAINTKFTEGEESEVTISAVDSIEARRDIYEKMTGSQMLYIDARAAGNVGSIFTLPCFDIQRLTCYERNLQDDDVYVAPCTERMTTYIAPMIAAQVASIVANYCNSYEVGPYIRTFDMKNCLVLTETAEDAQTRLDIEEQEKASSE